MRRQRTVEARGARYPRIALVALLLLAGCRSGRRTGGDVVVFEPVPSPPPPAPVVEVVPAVTPEPLVSPLDLADQAFEAGDFAGALVGYQSHLDGDAAGEATDRAVFRLAVLHLMNGGPAPDPATGYSLLRRLVRDHPESPYRPEADVILGLTTRVDGLETEVERLESQLEALKRIDLDRSPDG